MKNYKFSEGDRVIVTKIDNLDYYAGGKINPHMVLGLKMGNVGRQKSTG